MAQELNPQDFNGHTPDDSGDDQPGEPEVCSCCVQEDPYYQLGYKQAIIDMLGRLAGQAQSNVAEMLATLERRAVPA